MIEALIQGILCGLLLSVSIGPVFFALIQTSIHKGFKAGAIMATGIMISDSLYIIITYLGISSIKNVESLEVWLGILGGIIMLAFGVATLFKKNFQNLKQENSVSANKNYKYLVKGFALNGINPSVFIFWLGVSSFVNFEATGELFVYFCSIIIIVYSIDLTKVFLANRLREYITEKLQTMLNRMVGTGLLIFGIYMIATAIIERY